MNPKVIKLILILLPGYIYDCEERMEYIRQLKADNDYARMVGLPGYTK